MNNKRVIILSLSVLAAAALACNLPSFFSPESESDIEAAVQQTLMAVSGETVEQEQSPEVTPIPPTEALPTDTPLPSDTPTVTATFTPSVPMVSVTNNTNCRTGPGTAYDLVGALLIGEEAEIVARSSVPNYVIIELPGSPGTTCWLWMQYGQISGSTDGLPVLDPPPTPTPAASPTPELNFNLSYDGVDTCSGKDTVFIRIKNTGALKIESREVSAKDQDTNEVVGHSSNMFGGSGSCISLAIPYISPGNSVYTGVGFTPPTAGHTISVSVKACAGDGLAQPCLTKSISFDLPNVSDVDSKENFEPVDNQQILEQVSDLPITTWNYRDFDRPGRHIGPMAQDFYSTFNVGQSSEYINTVDAYGVSLAAIQALTDISQGQAEQIELLTAQNEALASQNTDLEARMETLEAEADREPYLQAGLLIMAQFIAVTGILLIVKRRRRINHIDSK